MLLSPAWRKAQLQKRLATWEPLIGANATITSTRGLLFNQVGFLIGLGFVVCCVVLEVLHAKAIFYYLIPVPVFLISLYYLIQGARLRILASRQASELLAGYRKAGVPTQNVESFERWQKQSKYSKNQT